MDCGDMAAWLVRAGRNGEFETVALEKGYAVIGWDRLQDLREIKNRDELYDVCQKAYPEKGRSAIANYVGQLWGFKEKIMIGDLIVLPLKTRAAIAVGKVEGPYEYRDDLPMGVRHARRVKWIRTDIPRSAFGQDLLYSLGAFMTVCRIKRNDAEKRIEAILQGKPDAIVTQAEKGEPKSDSENEVEIDYEEAALDQIREYIGRKFKGHGMARLVDSVLKAQGYHTRLSPEGPDEGADILAGKGKLGFDSPKICVQVKSSDSPIDVSVLRELEGVMKNFRAEHGILVSWGGFKGSVLKESTKSFFDVRLWDANDFVRVLLEGYDQLPEEIKAELPLQRIWAKVPEEE